MSLDLICSLTAFGLLLLSQYVASVRLRNNHTKADLLEELFVRRGYDKRVRPGEDDGDPVIVAVSFYVNSISHIDEVNSNFQVEMYFRTQWWDKRMAHNYSTEVISLGQSITQLTWHPDVYFENEEDSHEHFFTTHNTGYWLWPNGSMANSKRVSARFSCEMDMREYPMDEQHCLITVLSYSHGRSEMDLKWFDGTSPIQLGGDIRIPEFDIHSYNHSVQDVSYTLGGDYRLLHFNLVLRRQFGLYFINTYSPSILVVVMSWVTFWIDPRNTTPRVSIGLLTVLTMSTQTSSILSSLPRVTYIKAMDIWMISCLLYVFIAFLETALITVLTFSSSNDDTDTPETKPKMQRKTVMMAFEPTKVSPFPETNPKSNVLPTTPTKRKGHIRAVACIDSTCRFGAPLSFFVFCLVYFISYISF